MKKPFIAMLCILNLIGSQSAAQVEFQKTYSGTACCGGGIAVVKATSDGGFALFTTFDNPTKENDFFLIKLNSIGDTMWTHSYGGDGYESLRDGLQTFDGGYVLFGKTRGFGTTTDCFYIVKTNPAGDISWSRVYGSNGHQFDPFSIEQTSDGGYIMAGYAYDTTTVGYCLSCSHFLLIRTDATGDTLWTKVCGEWSGDFLLKIQQTSDQGFIAIGYSESFLPQLIQTYLVKFNPSGSVSWSKTYICGTFIDYGTWVEETIDGGFILAGHKRDTDIFATDPYLIKTNNTGDVEWAAIYSMPFEDYAQAVHQTSDSGYIFCGTYNDGNNGKIYTIKTNSSGDTLWTRTYGDNGYHRAYNILETPDKGILTSAHYSGDPYLIKTDSTGFSPCLQFYPEITPVPSAAIAVTQTTLSYQYTDFYDFIPATVDSAGGYQNTLCIHCNLPVVIQLSGDTSLCDGDSLIMTSNYPMAFHLWSSGDTTNSIVVSDSGSFFVSIIDSQGCIGTSGVVSIAVHSQASGNFTGLPDTACADWSAFPLNGFPLGGVFNGPGITGNIFNPALANNGWNAIQYSVADSNGCTVLAFDSAFVDLCLLTSDPSKNANPKILFNHETNIVQISSPLQPIRYIEVTNSTGEIVVKEELVNQLNSNEVFLNLESFSQGLYIVMVITASERKFKKILKD